MELIFATNNRHKLQEISALLDRRFTVLGLWELDAAEDIPEDHDTLEDNASQKAWHIYRRFNRNCFADDTGLEVEALNGAPGVYSARYARIGSMTFPDMEPASGNMDIPCKQDRATAQFYDNWRARSRSTGWIYNFSAHLSHYAPNLIIGSHDLKIGTEFETSTTDSESTYTGGEMIYLMNGVNYMKIAISSVQIGDL